MSEPQHPQEFIVGGRYRVIRELGRGGMGSVYEAENLRTRRRVALKTMRPEVSDRDGYAQRFEREAQAAGQLHHPNVIDVIDMGDDAAYGLMFIVQEFLHGGDLAKCLKQVGALPPQAVVATLLPIMDALEAAHAHGIIHRDLKPDNIFLHETPRGVVPKLIDFGIAKFTQVHSEEELSCTATGQMIGSPNYVSPEQARGDADIDPCSDVWSLGVVFYKCLSRSIPYSAPTPSSLVAKIIYEEPIALAQLAPHLPADLVAVVQRAVVKDRAQRWPSMRAFADALRGCALWQGVDGATAQGWVVNERGETLTPLPPLTPSWAPTGPAPLEPDASPEHPSGLRSGPWGGEVSVERSSPTRASRSATVLAAVLGVIGLGVASTAAYLWPRRPRPTPTGVVIYTTPPDEIAPAPAAAPAAPPAALPVDAGAAAPAVAVVAPSPASPPPPAEPVVRVAPAPARPTRRARPAAPPQDPARRGHNGALILR
ncbi:MAG: serine/threonine-protein kinase [Myxococcales bacterium]|nr:serine/threonine-protein kinase [Myxococcales bacterium]